MAKAKVSKPSKLIEIHIEENTARVFVLFLQTAYAVEKFSENELFRAGLSISKLMALQIIETNGGVTTPSTIARWMLREKNNITTLVDRLNRDGFVRVDRASNVDRRTVNVILTDKGRQALKKIRPVTRRIINTVMAEMKDEAVLFLEKQLKVLRLNAHRGMDEKTKP